MRFYNYEKMGELQEEYSMNERATINKMIRDARTNKTKSKDVVTRRNGTYYVMTKEEFVKRAVKDLAIRKAERERLKKLSEEQENNLGDIKEKEIITTVNESKKKTTIKKTKNLTKKKEEKVTTIKENPITIKHNKISPKDIAFKEIKRKDDNFQIVFAF